MNLFTKYIANRSIICKFHELIYQIHCQSLKNIGFSKCTSIMKKSKTRSCDCGHVCTPQSIQRVAMSTFWRTFHRDGKISPARWGCGLHALPLSLYLPSPAKLWCTLQLRGLIHSPYFSSTPICTLRCTLLVIMIVATAMRGRRWTIWRHCAIKKKKK
jgi:hypothetical protein